MKYYLLWLLSLSSCTLIVAGASLSLRHHSTTPAVSSTKDVIASSVFVMTGKGTGSGPVVVRDDDAFVWTAAHVVTPLRTLRTVIDSETGTPKVLACYADPVVGVEGYQTGCKTSQHMYYAEILRMSPEEDLALLHVRERGVFRKGVCFTGPHEHFAPDTPIFHVGSMDGLPGANSISHGHLARAGRRRHNKFYDQINLTALSGSSGGGVYLENGRCIGILVQGLTETSDGVNLMVPAWRMWEYARRTNCLWALDATVPVPGLEAMQATPVEEWLPLPDDWKTPPPQAVEMPEGK